MISLYRENLRTVDHTATVYRIVTGIIDFDTHSRLNLVRFRLLKTATSGEEHMRIMFIINLYEIPRVTQSWPPQATPATAVAWRRQGQYRQSTTRWLERSADEQ